MVYEIPEYAVPPAPELSLPPIPSMSLDTKTQAIIDDIETKARKTGTRPSGAWYDKHKHMQRMQSIPSDIVTRYDAYITASRSAKPRPRTGSRIAAHIAMQREVRIVILKLCARDIYDTLPPSARRMIHALYVQCRDSPEISVTSKEYDMVKSIVALGAP